MAILTDKAYASIGGPFQAPIKRRPGFGMPEKHRILNGVHARL